jgi:hypothetical protein
MKSSDVARLVVALSDAATTAEKRSAVEFLRTVCPHDGDECRAGALVTCACCGAPLRGVYVLTL